jgi:DNA topoisomerase-1
LKSQNIPDKISASRKLEYYTEANIDIALKLNHQQAVSESYDNSLDNMKNRLKEMKQQLKEKKDECKKELEEAKEKKDQRIDFAKDRREGGKQKEAIKRANNAYRKKKEILDGRINRLNERITNMESKIAIKKKTRGVALGTSKGNYADPRILVSWCKDNEVDVKRIFSKTLKEKFEWAMDIDEDFYKKYPNV